MKKAFIYMTVMIAAIAMNSCGSDDNDWKTAPNIAKMLCAHDWEGYNHSQYRELGKWLDSGSDDVYVVLRFNRANDNANSGTGYHLGFSNSYKTELKGSSEFTWTLIGNNLRIDYKAGWNSVHTTYNNNEFVISDTNFHGLFYANEAHRIEFNYKSTTFSDWNKYFK